MTQASAIAFFPPISPEDRARADMYALLSRLFYAAPDESLLRALATAGSFAVEDEVSSLASAWQELTAAAALADADEVRFEYDGIFVGAGKADITLYSTAYLTGITHNGHGAEKHLVVLRDDLANLGIVRRESVHEPEDHFSALCDVMRFLIVGDEQTPAASLDQQREFFAAHIGRWFGRFAAAIEAHQGISFYRPVGRFLCDFLELENESFEMG